MSTEKLRLYSTSTKEVEEFTPIREGEVGVYSCGPTVYHYAHIGNLRAYVFADVLRRTFTHAGYKVQHIINITDVGHLVGDGNDGQDKLEKGAAREGKNVWEIAKEYTDAFMKDLTALNIPLDAYTFPRATDHIREQIGLIATLEIEGYTYRTSDGIYFDTSKFERYADLAHLNIEGLQSGARVEENVEKRNITDFALWKLSPTDEKRQMEWDSPWGKGFPGWHIECSAMAMKYLGEHFDIHTGGIDHIPVHHTNEITQSECATGMKYVNYWMHVNFLNDKQGKMSKSNDDFLRLTVLKEKGYAPLAYRYYLLTAHYRSELDFSFENLDAAATAYHKLITWCETNRTDGGIVSDTYIHEFKEVMHNDINTPKALALIWILTKDDAVTQADKYATLLSFDEILGLGLSSAKKEEYSTPDAVQTLLNARALARASSDYAESDRLRDEIAKLGYAVKDSKGVQEIVKN
jgi:cysteinyl-tRNA synthetase